MVGIYPGVYLGDYIPKGYSLDFLTSVSIGFAIHHLEQEQTILTLRAGGGGLGMTQDIKLNMFSGLKWGKNFQHLSALGQSLVKNQGTP